jgi:hypothetical protein
MRNKTSIGVIAIFAVMVGMAVFVSRANAQAAAVYSWEYDNQNFYQEYGLTYRMTGLTIGAEYQWQFQQLDDNGLVVDVIATRSLTATATSETIHINNFEFPDNTFAPLKVIDNYGNILTKHYFAPEFPNFPGAFEWEQSNGNTLENEKQSPGALFNTGPCTSPPYNETLINGWQHTGVACSVATLPNGYMLLHYRMDTADYGSGYVIQMHQISPEVQDIYTFEIDEMVDYNRTGHNTFFSAGSQQTHNFVVLNTSGEPLNFIDGQASLAFTGDNPMRVSFDPGAYACTREDSVGAWVSDCESVMLVSNDPQGNEWSLDFVNGTVAPDGTQIGRFGQSTSQIHTAYSGGSTFSDSLNGVLDLTVYPFSTLRAFAYTIDASAVDGTVVTGTWTLVPATLPTQLANPDQMFFTARRKADIGVPTYTVGEVDFGSGLREILIQTGFDTAAGQITLFIVLVVLGSGLFWFFHIPAIVHSVWYLFVGGLLLMVVIGNDVASGLFVILFTITAPLIALYGIMGRNGEGSGDIA